MLVRKSQGTYIYSSVQYVLAPQVPFSVYKMKYLSLKTYLNNVLYDTEHCICCMFH